MQGASAKNFGVTHSAIWLKVRLQTRADAPAHWMLEVRSPPLDRLDLFVSNTSGGYDQQSGGDSLPFAQRPVPHRNPVKPILLVPGGDTTLYLRVQSEGNVPAPMTLWQLVAL
nr:7TM-DISM domain-containing protein [Rhodoferax sp.]